MIPRQRRGSRGRQTVLAKSRATWDHARPMKSSLLAHGRRWVFSSVHAILGLVWLALAGSVKLAAAPAKPGPLDFIRAQGERRYAKVPREVLAFYYTWYGTPETQGLPTAK